MWWSRASRSSSKNSRSHLLQAKYNKQSICHQSSITLPTRNCVLGSGISGASWSSWSHLFLMKTNCSLNVRKAPLFPGSRADFADRRIPMIGSRQRESLPRYRAASHVLSCRAHFSRLKHIAENVRSCSIRDAREVLPLKVK